MIPLGRCYPWAYKYLQKHPDAVLVHGTVSEPFGSKKRIDHAWIVHNGLVKDWQTMEAHMGGIYAGKGYPWPVYRELWSARPEAEYTDETIDEALRQCVIDEGRWHYGPWHKNPKRRGRYDPAHIVSAVIAVRKGDRTLLLKRGRTDPWMPGKWCLPGGAIDPGEGPFEGALRELDEEAGLCLSAHDILPLDVIEMDTTTVYVFTAKAPRERVHLRDGEHSEFRWVAPDEIHSLQTIPLVKPILRSMNTNGRSRSSSKTRTLRAYKRRR